MMGLLRLAAVAAFLATAALLNGGQTSVTTWKHEPDPTGWVEGPYLAMMSNHDEWEARDLEDFDTRTVATLANGSCNTSESLVLDGSNYEDSDWLWFDRGIPGQQQDKGTWLEYGPLSSWNYLSEGVGDLGSSAPTDFLFVFSDGRAEEDPRKDYLLLAGFSTTKLIPDLMTTAYGGCVLVYPGGIPKCYLFKHTVHNQDYPDFLEFSGLEIKEVLYSVWCSDGPCDTDLLQTLQGQANGVWNLEGNELKHCDCHGPGGALTNALLQNQHVIVYQEYKILNDNWDGKNPFHAIGRAKGLSGLITGFHIIKFSFVGGMPSCLLVEKNGISAGHCENSCADDVDPVVCPPWPS